VSGHTHRIQQAVSTQLNWLERSTISGTYHSAYCHHPTPQIYILLGTTSIMPMLSIYKLANLCSIRFQIVVFMFLCTLFFLLSFLFLYKANDNRKFASIETQKIVVLLWRVNWKWRPICRVRWNV
jgi:hypothetical protein